MQQTSLDAYVAIREVLPKKRQAVLDAMEMHPDGVTLFELVKIMGKPVNHLSGRITELKESGLIVDAGRRVNPETNKSAIVWVVKK